MGRRDHAIQVGKCLPGKQEITTWHCRVSRFGNSAALTLGDEKPADLRTRQVTAEVAMPAVKKRVTKAPADVIVSLLLSVAPAPLFLSGWAALYL